MDEQKKFTFPENVNKSYDVFLGLGVRDIVLFIAPIAVIGIISFFIPPQTVTSTIVKLLVTTVLLTIVIAVLTSKPVKYRNNIRLTQYLKMRKAYDNRQKLYFIDTKKEER